MNSTRFTLSQLMLSSLYLVRLTLYTGLYAVVLKGKDSTSMAQEALGIDGFDGIHRIYPIFSLSGSAKSLLSRVGSTLL